MDSTNWHPSHYFSQIPAIYFATSAPLQASLPHDGLVGLQIILLKVPRNFWIDKLRAILKMEADYNFLAKYLIHKILMSRGEAARVITQGIIW